MTKKIKARLFDFDGVIAETMEEHFIAWKNALSEYGIEIKERDYYPLEGTKIVKIAKILCNKYNKETKCYEEIVQKKVDYYIKNHNLRFYPAVEEFIDLLSKKNVLKGIVSASSHEQLIKTVGKEFLDKFSVVVHGNSTKRGKPFPDPYLIGAEKLGLNHEECLVIENAPLGIESAKKAGMYCIAISSTVEKGILREADLIIKNFRELNELPIVKQLIGSG